jgi:tetratricopeptide (TPR) repeat protein
MRYILVFILLFSLPAVADNTQSRDYQTRKKFDYFFFEAMRLKQNDRNGDAFNALQHALRIDSTSSVTLYEIADYYLSLNEDSLLIDALQKAVKYDPANFEYKSSLANTYRDFGQSTEAIRLYEELVAEYPDKAEIHFFLSDLYLRENQVDKSIKSLDALENNIGMNEALSMQKFKLYIAVAQEENAVKEIEKLMSKFPAEAKYPIVIGDYYLSKNDVDRALIYYEKSNQMDPQNPFYTVAMVNYYEHIGDKETAKTKVEAILKNLNLDMDIKLSILGKYVSTLLYKDKDVDTANALFHDLLEQHSQEMGLHLMYAQFLLAQNRMEEAKFQFQVITEADPENILAWQKLLGIAISENNADEIILLCDRALLYFPEASEFYLYKGLGHNQKSEYQEALNTLLKGLIYIDSEDNNKLSTFYGLIGDLYHQTGQKEEAWKAYDKALEYNENNVLVLNNYAYFLSLDKIRLEQAERMSGKCIKAEPKNPTYIDTYAWVLFQRGNYSLAKFYIESAISTESENSPDIIEHYGDILFKTGNTEKAVQQWEKALKLRNDKKTALLRKKIENKMYYESE